MTTNNIEIYEGDEAFLLASFADTDSDRVYPVLETLSATGYRLQFNAPNSTEEEWSNNSPILLDSCHLVLLFISPAWIASENCQNDLTFAKLRDKKIIGILLERMTMPYELEEKFKEFECIRKYEYYDETRFYQHLFRNKDLNICFYTAEEIAMNAGSLSSPYLDSVSTSVYSGSIVTPDYYETLSAAKQSGGYDSMNTSPVVAPITVPGNSPVNGPINTPVSTPVNFSGNTMTNSHIVEPSGSPVGTPINSQPMNIVYDSKPNLFSEQIFTDASAEETITESERFNNMVNTLQKKKKKNALKICLIVGVIILIFIVFGIVTSPHKVQITPMQTEYSDETNLTISSCAVTKDTVKKLNKFKQLRSLSFNKCDLSQFDPADLKSFDNLYFLTISNCRGITDYTFIKDADNLHSVSIDNIPAFNDIESCIPQDVYYLSISDCPITDISVLETYDSLNSLSISNCTLDNVDSSFCLYDLNQLTLSNCGMTDFTFIKNSPNLYQIDLSGNNVGNFEFSVDFVNYGERLDLSDTELSSVMQKRISECTAIKYLSVNNVPLKDLSMVKDMKNLTILRAANCGIENIDDDTFKGMNSLQDVILCNNKLTKIPIYENTTSKYYYVDLSHNNITSFSGIEKCPSYNALFLYDNPIDWTDKDSLKVYENAVIGHLAISYDPDAGKTNLKPDQITVVTVIDCPNETEENNYYRDFGIYTFLSTENADTLKYSDDLYDYNWGLYPAFY